MIWDNFSIFRTNCAILTSYIRADPRTCRWLSRGCCHVAWSKWWVWRDSLADFSQRWQGIRQGIRSRALTCSCMIWANGKSEFFQGPKQFRAVNEYDPLAQSSKHVRVCATGDGAICSKNRKIVRYHGDSASGRISARDYGSWLVMVIGLSGVQLGL